ncbi:MAG: glycosyltransferase, partial [Bacteroidetes bacterium]
GYYSADTDRFLAAQPDFSQSAPTLLYLGRIMAHKGIGDLLEAFLPLADRTSWRLQLVGKADGSVPIPDHPKVIHQDFVQPEDLSALLAQATAFVLPSREEPWGVALHEAAAAGLPLLVSDACGAGDAFLTHGQNGWLFQAGQIPDLQAALERLFQMQPERLAAMGTHSRQLAQTITPATWAQTLMDMIDAYRKEYAR